MAGLILVANAGSSSLKLSVVRNDDTTTPVDSLEDAPYGVRAVAHRIVHGGDRFREPVVIDDAVRDELVALGDLAPLHNRLEVGVLDEARRLLPEVPHVAVFDTAFHAAIPEEAAAYAVPRRWREEWGIRRYGFHGLSVQWSAGQVPAPRLIVCHLGAGCSVTAVEDGRSVDTTMGFSPLDGVPMATRAGAVDPAIPLYLLRTGRLDVGEIEHALERESGLLGLSGSSGRVEVLERSADPAARLALAVFVHRVSCAVAAMAAALRGLDALVFTGGVGERSAPVRSGICDRLGFLGVELDERANEQAEPDAEIHAGRVRVVVVRAREDVVAAREARRALAAKMTQTSSSTAVS
ncbi:MAG: acetate/propionate family kinase [Gaiellaceae bacterium]